MHQQLLRWLLHSRSVPAKWRKVLPVLCRPRSRTEEVPAVAKYKGGSLPLNPLMGYPSFEQSCTSWYFIVHRWTTENLSLKWILFSCLIIVTSINTTMAKIRLVGPHTCKHLESCVLPLGVSLVCYCLISRRLRRPPRPGRARRNSLRIIFAVEGAFVGSWLPFGVLRAVFHLARLGALPLPCGLLLALRWGLSIATCLAFVNSCANPLIYLLLDRSFRARAWREVCGRSDRPGRRGSSASSLSRDDSSVFRSPPGSSERARTANAGPALL